MNELQEQLESICTNICKGIPYEAELYNSMLFILGDDTVLYIAQLTNIPNNVKYQINNTSYYYMYPEDLENKIFRIYNEIIKSNYPLIYSDDNPRKDPKFEELLNKSSEDGANFYYINTENAHPFIPIIKGFPNMCKSDSISLSLYDAGNHSMIVKYDILKKKQNIRYQMYYKILDVNRIEN